MARMTQGTQVERQACEAARAAISALDDKLTELLEDGPGGTPYLGEIAEARDGAVSALLRLHAIAPEMEVLVDAWPHSASTTPGALAALVSAGALVEELSDLADGLARMATVKPTMPAVTVRARPCDCPRCGSPMVLRTARRGKNSGGQFYGCSTYPRCVGSRAAAPDGSPVATWHEVGVRPDADDEEMDDPPGVDDW